MSLEIRVKAAITLIGADVKALLTGQNQRPPIIVRNEGAGTYAARSTVTSSSTLPVIYFGTVAPTTGFIAGVDIFFRKT